MQLSRTVDYALLALIYLARSPMQTASVNEIACDQRLSLYYLRKIFQQLKKVKLLESQPSRGYRLARAPEQISLREVIEAVEGPTALQSCLSANGCAKQNYCQLAKTWAAIQKRFLADLDRTHLNDLI